MNRLKTYVYKAERKEESASTIDPSIVPSNVELESYRTGTNCGK